MRVNSENKSADIEARDMNYILPQYVKSYLFYNKNEMPEKIIFPMFESVNVLSADGKMHPVPIEWVAPTSEVAEEIAKDGEDIAEVTQEQEADKDEREDRIKELKAELDTLTTDERGGEVERGTPETVTPEPTPEETEVVPAPEDLVRQQEESEPQASEPEVSAARAAFAEPTSTEPSAVPDRQPKQAPGGDVGPGLGLSDTHARDAQELARMTRDLAEGPELSETEEKLFEKEISRDEHGNPVVEE